MEKYQGIMIFELIFQAVNCKWDQWGYWSLCTKTCGGGITTRKRVKKVEAAYEGEDCIGETEETKDCQQQLCCKSFATLISQHYIKRFERSISL